MLIDTVKKFDASKKTGIFEFIALNIRELIIFRHALYNFISTQLSSRYRRSTIGFLWSLLNPLFTMLIMALVFSSLYKLPFKGFSLYLFSGLVAWNLTTASLMSGANSLINSEAFLKKIYIPKVLFPLVALGVEVINFLFSLISLFLLAFLLGSTFGLSLILLPVALLLLSIFLFGLVLMVSIFTVFFRDLVHILQIVLLGLFYLTPILYQKEMLTVQMQSILEYNPFYHFVNLFHMMIYQAISPTWADWQPCILLAVISLCLGLIVFHRKENDVIYRL